MRKARIFIAVLLALSVVLLPMGAAMAAPAPHNAAASAAVDCDHHQHGHALPQKAPPADDHCLAMVNCGLCCATLTAVGVGGLVRNLGLGTPIDSVDPSGPSLSWLAPPPLRPPRL